jgi:transposase
VAEFQRLTTEEQTRIVKATKAEGASIRQVMSHTGWSYRRVREAGGGAAVKS